jgi:transposase
MELLGGLLLVALVFGSIYAASNAQKGLVDPADTQRVHLEELPPLVQLGLVDKAWRWTWLLIQRCLLGAALGERIGVSDAEWALIGPLFRMLADRIEALLADKGYDAGAIRAEIEAAGVEAVIPAKSNRRVPIPHDREKHRWRNLVARLFSKLKNWRRVATRYDKTRESYLGFVALAPIKLWIPLVHAA